MSAQLPGVFQSLSPVLDRYGYAAIVVLVGLEGVGIPLPGQLILIAAGVYAGLGQFNIVVVLLLGLLAAVGGDNAGYAVGRYGGRELVQRFGRYVFLTEKRLAATERFFDKRGPVVVVIGRFVDGLRQASGIAAGLARMGWQRYLAYNAAGSLVWVGVWVFAGYLAGSHIEALYRGLVHYQKFLLGALAVALIAVIVRWVVKRRSAQRAAAEC
ncbi:alkaline phosphatase [Mycobacterium intermedium]|uniref:Alkaline phosphatase n=1 Tax=Mycobacterium intermedium TaxID=28445 RepID=A0A1E3S6E3_MYCIE|nr:DedA family protein [Mycobacterium intermedium]MCV6966936.1 DedA family protein [Mycobacterium intermedium]ODQ97212.1 alkaline phosphatase [Mycobacterium intermedium]OPE47140.1 alkaline phosphatase [Mycobacterium intermedium]ORA95690.1 alkaline phosphatase [Mycobacterium intermedium]